MAAERTQDGNALDVLDLLDEIHGDGMSRREATVNTAVGEIERSAYKGYSGMRDLAQRGTPRHAAAATPPAATPVPESAAEASLEPNLDPSNAPTRVATAPVKPQKLEDLEASDPADVISGEGAIFRERGHTQTHVIRRPKNWFGRR